MIGFMHDEVEIGQPSGCRVRSMSGLDWLGSRILKSRVPHTCTE